MAGTTLAPLHLSPEGYHLIGPEDFGAPGLWARESVGPSAQVPSVGPVLTVHDSTFEARSGIGHHPHRGMERLFYILEGTVDHDDALNDITGHMGTGDLGILTEGERGMLHSEWNNGDEPARAYILVYPTDPTPPAAAFDAIRDGEAGRSEPAPGVVTKQVVERGSTRLRGDVREFADSILRDGAALELPLDGDEAALVFVVEGSVDVETEAEPAAAMRATREHTVVVPPAEQPRSLLLLAKAPSRVLHAITGPGRELVEG